MSEQADDITSYTSDRKTTLDYIFTVGSWLVSCVSLVIIGLIAYWAIKIPEKNDIPWFSRKNTTSHQCCEKYSEEEKNMVLEKISEEEKWIEEEHTKEEYEER